MLLVDDLAAGGTKNLRHTPRGLVTAMLLVDDLAAGGTKNLRHTPHGLVTLNTQNPWL